MDKIRNFTAAFPSISESVKKIGLQEFPYFRTLEFDELTLQIKFKLLKIANANEHNLAILNSTGTGAMDAAVSNLIPENAKIMVIIGGRFGELWKQISSCYTNNIFNYNIVPGQNIDLNYLEQELQSTKPYALLMQHNETSMMHLFDIEKIGNICHKYNIKLFVDACSSFAIDFMDVSKYKIDVLVFSSQKGLLIPAGLSFVIFKKNLELISRNYYFNLSYYNKNEGRFIQPFTPPVILMNQLNYQLDNILNQSINKWIEQISKKANYFREKAKKIQLNISSENLTNCGTLIYNRGDNFELCELLKKLNIYVVNSKGWWGDYISVGHIGEVSYEDMDVLLFQLEKWYLK